MFAPSAPVAGSTRYAGIIVCRMRIPSKTGPSNVVRSVFERTTRTLHHRMGSRDSPKALIWIVDSAGRGVPRARGSPLCLRHAFRIHVTRSVDGRTAVRVRHDSNHEHVQPTVVYGPGGGRTDVEGRPAAAAVVRRRRQVCQMLLSDAVPKTSSRPSWFPPTARLRQRPGSRPVEVHSS
jgi:hypothetical protein